MVELASALVPTKKKNPDNLNLICVKLFMNKFAASSVNAFAANFPLVILEQIRCLDYLKIVQPDLLKPDEVELATNLPKNGFFLIFYYWYTCRRGFMGCPTVSVLLSSSVEEINQLSLLHSHSYIPISLYKPLGLPQIEALAYATMVCTNGDP